MAWPASVKFCLVAAGVLACSGMSVGPTRAETITFEQILANPNDLELTYAYARQQVRTGRLEQAAASLERLLLLQPDWDAARLFYALVLYRLDDLEGAQRELTLLQGRPLSAAQSAEVARYLAQIEAESKATRVTGAVTVGSRVDSNPAAIPNSDFALSDGDPVALTAEERVDGAFLAGAEIRIEHDLDSGQGNYLFLHARGDMREQFEVTEADFLAGTVHAGASLFFGDLEIRPGAFYAAYGLGNELYLQEVGPKLHAEYVVSPGLAVFAKAAFAWQNHEDTTDDPEGEERDGWRLGAGGGFRARLTDRNTVNIHASYLERNAKADQHSYRGVEAFAGTQQLLGMGQYLLAEAWYWHLDYDAPDPEISSRIERADDRYKLRLAYGVPVGTILKVFGAENGASLDTIDVQLSASYYNQNSNIPNFDNDNISGEVLFTKNFGF